jgi:DNA invertase Pin-like site-specific DNA recombinase
VSSVEQNTGRQLEGIEVDRIFVDRASGKNTDRPKFQEMLNYVREGQGDCTFHGSFCAKPERFGH